MIKRILYILLLATSVGASAATLNPVQLLNPAGSISGQVISSTGPTTPPAWSGISASSLAGIVTVAHGGTSLGIASGVALDNITGFSGTGFLTRTGAGTYAFQSAVNGITYGNLAQAGANTLLGNSTSSSANVAPVAVTGCNGAAQALQWTNGSGFGCNSAIATSGANSNITSLSGLSTPLSVTQGGTGVAASTGTGSVVLSASPTLTGTLNAAAITATGAITPSQTAGIVGTTTNNNANAGSIGEFPAPTNLTGVSITTNTPFNASSVSLTAGDWDVSGCVYFLLASSTTLSATVAAINTTSATLPTNPGPNLAFLNASFTSGPSSNYMCSPVARISLSSTTTVFLVGQATFGASTITANGYLRARRAR